MNKKILKKSIKKFNKISKEYDGFINVVFDDWRGFRFIFDTTDVKKCNNDCKNCPLYNSLKKCGINKNCFGLFPATKKDKKLFGPQKFLNCKTLNQYKNCFINFILKETKNEKELIKELNLIKNFKIIYSKNRNKKILERGVKRSIIKKLLKEMPEKKNLLEKYLQ